MKNRLATAGVAYWSKSDAFVVLDIGTNVRVLIKKEDFDKLKQGQGVCIDVYWFVPRPNRRNET